MSFPQTRAAEEVLNGKDLWRLHTPIDSNGDIYELDTSASMIAIGPDSDVVRVLVSYYDDQAPSKVNSLVVKTNEPFIGRLDALLATQYEVSTTIGGDALNFAPMVGRVFVSPLDIIYQDYLPLSFVSPSESELLYPRTNLDVLSYLSPPAASPRARRDRSLITTVTPLPVGFGDPRSFVVLPHYGRKLVTIRASAGSPGSEMDVFGINFRTTGSFAFTETIIELGLSIPFGGSLGASVIADAAEFGFFDLIQVEIHKATPGSTVDLTIIQSDEVL